MNFNIDYLLIIGFVVERLFICLTEFVFEQVPGISAGEEGFAARASSLLQGRCHRIVWICCPVYVLNS